ncbi:MAG: nitric-oxide reductase large subunit [Hyphomicrobiales bacterium]
MKKEKRLWIWFGIVLVFSFAVLLIFGGEIYQKKPPIPERIVNENGDIIYTKEDIQKGQNVWQSIGGHEIGSIWGHGSYVAPDWTADYLHREALVILNILADVELGMNYEDLTDEYKAALEVQLQKLIRKNNYDPETKTLVLSNLRQQATNANNIYYTGLFTNDPELDKLRNAYSIPKNTIKDADRMHCFNAFLFWASWSCITERPGEDVTYSHNWPPDKTIGNVQTGSLIIWTGFSVIMLLIGIGLLAFYHARQQDKDEGVMDFPKKDPLIGLDPTKSMKSTLKYFWIVSILFIIQIISGVITAHYGVEGNGFYGMPLANILPYSITRTWHVQLAIFWIATAWLATGLYMAPAVSGHEPKYQRLGVNVLFVALIIVVVGSLTGQWFGVMQKLGLTENFWIGHQGYEYVDLGHFWQILLFVGLILWLVLLLRALLPALKKKTESRPLLVVFVIASVAIALFYGAGLMWGQHTHLSIVEYWRWWVVHLWVEGFFEVFATVIAAFLFTRMGLLKVRSATRAVLFSTIIFLFGGIIGTFHHLYFTGTPLAVLALGSTFSALEVVPLLFISYEAYHTLRLSKASSWVKAYKWPIYFLVSVGFWNLVGAGIFGFLINPPIALYYMQGLNTTAVHGHTALFGVYGMLGIGLTLFVLKGLYSKNVWKNSVIRVAFWLLNIGLLLMVLISVLPVGLSQTLASVNEGMWYARSQEFLTQDYMTTFKWLRVIGDTIFAIGAIALVVFIFGLATGHSLRKHEYDITDDDYPQINK